VHVDHPGEDDPGALEELELLAASAGASVCASITARRKHPDPATFLGKGKVGELAETVKGHQVQLAIVNHAISPVQERNLERAVGCRVLDRTGLILDIFAQRAASHEGKLQVELAQLRHLSTRLVRGWSHLERQKGGIGLRGPGETQLESDRRQIGERIRTIKRRLEKVHAQRGHRRRARRRVPVVTVSLVGYTNAGKSSLFNRLTGAGVYAADKLFATLDPTMRRLEIPQCGEVILADTVGFIRQLPHSLVDAFHSTLEEVSEAALLLLVVDAADEQRNDHIEQVNTVLAEIGAADVPRLLVFNKIDRIGRPASWSRNNLGLIDKVWVSAHTGEGMDLLVGAMGEYLRGERAVRHVVLSPAAGALRAAIYRNLDVLDEQITADGGWMMDVETTGRGLAWLESQVDDVLCRLEDVSAPVLARTCPGP
jgi:GTP-binding protein HflX